MKPDIQAALKQATDREKVARALRDALKAKAVNFLTQEAISGNDEEKA